MKAGVSTSVLPDGAKEELERLEVYEPDLVEFYTYPRRSLRLIARFCESRRITPALHVPTPHPARMPRYCPTGPEPDEARAAQRALRETVACAADLGAEHVVVHFPSPYPPYSRQALAEFGPPFLEAAAELGRRHAVRVLIENLTPNPYCATAVQYGELLASWPDLGLCLDVGHAFLLNGADAVLEFADVLGPRIRSLHLYDPGTLPPRHRPYPAPGVGHTPRLSHDVVQQILRTCRPAAVVLEHDPAPGSAGPGTLAWLRQANSRVGDETVAGRARRDGEDHDDERDR